MTEQRVEDRGAISPRTPLSPSVHSGGVQVREKFPLRQGCAGRPSRLTFALRATSRREKSASCRTRTSWRFN